MTNLDEIFHLPDLRFVQFCEEKFALNKGIYNTIDNYFFELGEQDIIKRRRLIFQFSLQHCAVGKKFGPGGLTRKLEDFMEQKSGLLQVN